MSQPGDGESAERALERIFLAYKIIGFFPMQTPFSTIRMVAHTLEIIAILKLPKPALCLLPTAMRQSYRGEGMDEEMVSHGNQ
jgi:hypothetical protein